MVNLVPFRRVEFALETIEQFIEHLTLAVVERSVVMLVPETLLHHHPLSLVKGSLNRLAQCLKKPHYPLRNVQTALLRPL